VAKIVNGAAVLGVIGSPVALGFVLGYAGSDTGRTVGCLGVAALFATSAMVVAQRLWPERGVGANLGVVVASLALAALAFALSIPVLFLITINASLCGPNGDGLVSASSYAEAAAYLAIGYWAFLRPNRPLWGWPLAVLLALAVGIAVQAIVPGGHGYCET